jgi:hypothetical protein
LFTGSSGAALGDCLGELPARFDHAFAIKAEDFSAGAVCAVPVGGAHPVGGRS